MPKFTPLPIGTQFHRLTVIGDRVNGKIPCRCDCGVEKHFSPYHLRNGVSRSCGCLQRDTVGALRRSHGMSKDTTYNIWQAMISRCENVKNIAYPNYGGRGIKVHQPWRQSFEAFVASVGRRPAGMTLERLDNSKGYEPGNVKWATRIEQGANKRNNVLVVYNGEVVNVAEAARRSGKAKSCLRRRIELGWPADRLFT